MLANFRLQTEIGSGSFGKVYKATLDKKPVAAKVLHDYLFNWQDPRRIVDKFEQECRILQGLKHKNVVQLVEFVISHSSPPMLITELMDCDLGKYVYQIQRNKIPFPEIVSIMLDVAEGLAYLHYECNPPIVHRDLASKNVLLTEKRQAKIADLGLAKFFSRDQRMLASPLPGTPAYAAPETYSNSTNPSPKVEYSIKIDIFSFGVILMEVINGRYPKTEPDWAFDSDGRRIPENERREGDISMMGEHKLKGLVLRCIEDDSDKRSNAEKVVERLQKEKSKIEKKRAIAQRTKPNEPPMLKIVPLGESGTGKTCIAKRFQDNSFTELEPSTIGLRFCYRNITLYGREFGLRIDDTGGQERFHSITPSFLRDTDGVLLVFDVTDSYTLETGIPKMVELLELLDGYQSGNTSIILVGNKVDATDRKVTRNRAETCAADLGVRYFETSAKTGQNIQEVFEEIAKEIYNKLDLSDIETYPLAGNGSVLLGQGHTETKNNKRTKSWRDRLSSWC